MRQLAYLICLITSFVSLAQVDWKLIYHNNEEGQGVEGDISILIQAVRDGKEIRLAWWAQSPTDPKRKVEHLADAAFLTIMSDSIVFGQIKPIYGQTPDFDAFTITLKENLEWVLIGGTNGKSDAMTRNTVTGEILGHNDRSRSLKWYVRQ